MKNVNQRGVTVLSPAKINTFLQVYQQRGDGYHDLFTHFQLIDLYDKLHFAVNDKGVIRVNNPQLTIQESDDLCYQAAQLLRADAKSNVGVTITVSKQIPAGGGLGGGSSNAATVLVVLNRLWNLGLSQEKLLQLGLRLGSDVPIFVYGKSTLAGGRGEKFSPLALPNPMENKKLLVVKPRVDIATAKIFQSERLTKRQDTGTIRDLDTAKLIRSGKNDFAPVVFQLYPEVAQVAKRLSVYSAAHLTGTGACLYMALDDVKKADKIIDALGRDCQVYLVNTIKQSPLNEFK